MSNFTLILMSKINLIGLNRHNKEVLFKSISKFLAPQNLETIIFFNLLCKLGCKEIMSSNDCRSVSVFSEGSTFTKKQLQPIKTTNILYSFFSLHQTSSVNKTTSQRCYRMTNCTGDRILLPSCLPQ